MTKRRFIVLFVVAFLGLPIGLQAQSVTPCLLWGVPDLQGIWLYWTATPLERPEEFGDKALVTPQEAAAYIAQLQSRSEESLKESLNGDWNPTTVSFLNGRTSLLIDPPNGRLPARTDAAQYRADTLGQSYDTRLRSANGPEDRESWERCILGRSVPFLPASFDQHLRILQTRDYVFIQHEEGERRLIPLNGQARLPESIRQWAGSSRGHWENGTLVVETANFNGKWSFHGTGSQMRLTERFTRIASGMLDYVFTIHDDESFASTWTVKFPLTRDPGPIYEYACHEGNYSLPLILSGARAVERGTTK